MSMPILAFIVGFTFALVVLVVNEIMIDHGVDPGSDSITEVWRKIVNRRNG